MPAGGQPIVGVCLCTTGRMLVFAALFRRPIGLAPRPARVATVCNASARAKNKHCAIGGCSLHARKPIRKHL
eukprot:4705144-Lingulodinium_polyedra.AAC.1